jgi:hypothetical protein
VHVDPPLDRRSGSDEGRGEPPGVDCSLDRRAKGHVAVVRRQGVVRHVTLGRDVALGIQVNPHRHGPRPHPARKAYGGYSGSLLSGFAYASVILSVGGAGRSPLVLGRALYGTFKTRTLVLPVGSATITLRW